MHPLSGHGPRPSDLLQNRPNLAGAAAGAPSTGAGAARKSFDQIRFCGLGRQLRPPICEKYHNPENSDNVLIYKTPPGGYGAASMGHPAQQKLIPESGGQFSVSEQESRRAGIPRDQIMFVGGAPVMNMVIEAMSTLGDKGLLSIRARENNIPRAVVVANILTEKMMKDNSQVYKILLDGDMRPDGSMASTIEIIMTKV